MEDGLQTVVHQSDRGAIVVMDSAADIRPHNRDHDVVVTASYVGVLPARLVNDHRPRAAIGFDGGVGPDGCAIAGLWYYEALNMPAATADVMTIILGDGLDVYRNGIVSFCNRPARDCGVQVGMPIHRAARLMLDNDPGAPGGYDVTNRTVAETSPDGRQIIITDSIVFAKPEDVRNVLVTAGHTGRSGARHIQTARPFGFICSDGGGGKANSGTAGLAIVEADGIAGATVDGRSARLGDGMSSYRDGFISAVNTLAANVGVEVGMPAAEAARLLLYRIA